LLPNFLIIGSASSGAGFVSSCLRGHPQVYLSPVLEPCFFHFEGEAVKYTGPRDREVYRNAGWGEIERACEEERPVLAVTDIEAYKRLFDGAGGRKAVGEASRIYLYSEKAPPRILHHLPGVKLIAVLRNPVDRAFAEYAARVMEDREPLGDFEAALAEEETRVREGWSPDWHYTRMGLYCQQLRSYFRLFGSDRIRVYLFEDIAQDAIAVARDIYRFLEIDESFSPDLPEKPEETLFPRSRWVHRVLAAPGPVKTGLKAILPENLWAGANAMVSGLDKRFNSRKLILPDSVRVRLSDFYRGDIEQLEVLIKRDLSTWTSSRVVQPALTH